MATIERALEKFMKRMEGNHPIYLTSNEKWREPNWLWRRIHYPINRNAKHLKDLGQAFVHFLEKIERNPVVFNCCQGRVKTQTELLKKCLEAARSVKKKLKNSSSEGIKETVNEINQHLAAIQYRFESLHGGLDPEVINPDIYRKVLNAAGHWKMNQWVITEKLFSPKEIEKLEEVCHYPKFAKRLIQDDKLKSLFFTWAIRDDNHVRTFIEFPSVCKRLIETKLSMRTSGGLAIAKKQRKGACKLGPREKVVTLPFYDGNKRNNISILDEEKSVLLNGNLQVKIKQILDAFKEKTYKPGEFDFFGKTGIWNWNFHQIGYWDPQLKAYQSIDMTRSEWWRQLPVHEVVSGMALEMKYGIHLKPKQWVAFAKATIENPHQELRNSHACLTVAMPLDDTNYQIFDFGKYATRYPRTNWDLIDMLLNTVPACIVYPDENRFYKDRAHEFTAFVLDDAEGRVLMEEIKKEIIKSKGFGVYFQPPGKNCAHWVQKTLEEVIPDRTPNLYKAKVVEYALAHPGMTQIFRFIQNLPTRLQRPVIKFGDRLFGSGRGIKIWKNGQVKLRSLAATKHREEQAIYLPAILYKRVITNEVPRIIYA